MKTFPALWKFLHLASCLLAALLPATSQVLTASTLTQDIEYAQAGGESQRLDVSVPEGKGPFPIIIIVHGGGWSGGDKSGRTKPNDGADITPLFEPLSRANFVWISINYRLAPKNHWPAALEDVQAAIRWVKSHAADYKGDPSRIATMGHSAGGHLVCLAATVAQEDTQVQAVVGLAAPTDLVSDCKRRGGVSPALRALFARPETIDEEITRILNECSAINHVHPGLPPFLLIHGTVDKSVPFSQSENFQSKLKAANVSCETLALPQAPHRLTEWAKSDAEWGTKMAEWLQRTLAATSKTKTP